MLGVGTLEQLDQYATARARMEECDQAVNTAARCAIDQLYPGRDQTLEGSGEVVDLEAEVMHRRASAVGEEASDA